MNPADMPPKDFAKWCYDQMHEDTIREAIEARDRRILEAAWNRVYRRAQMHDHVEMTKGDWDLRKAILGEPPFVKGQLVRFKVGRADLFGWPVKGDETRPNLYEPVRAHIDPEGRVIIDEGGEG